MWDIKGVNFADNVIDIVFAIVQYILITVLIGFIVNKIVNKTLEKQKHIGENLSKYGINKVSANKGGTLNKHDQNVLFGKNGYPFPTEVKLCFLTGWSFFRDYREDLKKLIENGTKIKILLGSPENARFTGCNIDDTEKLLDEMTEYYAKAYEEKDPLKSFLERETIMLADDILTAKDGKTVTDKMREKILKKDDEFVGDHIYQIYVIADLLKELNRSARNGGNISLHYYLDEYQMPIIMAKYNAVKKTEAKTLLWTNMNAPIRETKESINVLCEMKESTDSYYVKDVEKSFDYLYTRYPEEKL